MNENFFFFFLNLVPVLGFPVFEFPGENQHLCRKAAKALISSQKPFSASGEKTNSNAKRLPVLIKASELPCDTKKRKKKKSFAIIILIICICYISRKVKFISLCMGWGNHMAALILITFFPFLIKNFSTCAHLGRSFYQSHCKL